MTNEFGLLLRRLRILWLQTLFLVIFVSSFSLHTIKLMSLLHFLSWDYRRLRFKRKNVVAMVDSTKNNIRIIAMLNNITKWEPIFLNDFYSCFQLSFIEIRLTLLILGNLIDIDSCIYLNRCSFLRQRLYRLVTLQDELQ